VFLADGQLNLLLTFTGGVQANAKVVDADFEVVDDKK
jgi:hypothetical protein